MAPRLLCHPWACVSSPDGARFIHATPRDHAAPAAARPLGARRFVRGIGRRGRAGCEHELPRRGCRCGCRHRRCPGRGDRRCRRRARPRLPGRGARGRRALHRRDAAVGAQRRMVGLRVRQQSALHDGRRVQQWQLEPVGARSSCSGNPAGCPAAFDVDAGGACPVPGSCTYAEGRCACVQCGLSGCALNLCGPDAGSGADAGRVWQCAPWSKPRRARCPGRCSERRARSMGSSVVASTAAASSTTTRGWCASTATGPLAGVGADLRKVVSSRERPRCGGGRTSTTRYRLEMGGERASTIHCRLEMGGARTSTIRLPTGNGRRTSLREKS